MARSYLLVVTPSLDLSKLRYSILRGFRGDAGLILFMLYNVPSIKLMCFGVHIKPE